MTPITKELTRHNAEELLEFYRRRPPWIVHWFDPFPAVNAYEINRHLLQAENGETLSLGLTGSEGRIIGHAFVRGLHSDHPGLGMGIDESAQKKGLGRRLLESLLDECDSRGIPEINLNVFKNNTLARRLYRSCGFVNMGEHSCRDANDSVLMKRINGGTTGGSMQNALLQLLSGRRTERVVWTADISYWITGRKQDGTADPAWDEEKGYLQLHNDLGIMPYYYYRKFWTGSSVYDSSVTVRTEKQDNKTLKSIDTPRGNLRQEIVYLPESACSAAVKPFVKTEEDLDIMLYALEHRQLAPSNLDDYSTRRKMWSEHDGLPCLGLPRSPLPSFAYEWAGLENMVMLLLDCPEKVMRALEIMESQEEQIVEAVCRLSPPLVHFPDNLSSDNFTGYYDEHMRERHRSRLDRLHNAGIKAAVHLDGSVRGLLPKLAENGFDAVEALTPRPAGDITVEETAELTGNNDVILWGGVPGAMFAGSCKWPDMRKHVSNTIRTWQNRRFVLGVADQVPPDGDIEFCRSIADLANAAQPGGTAAEENRRG